MRREVQVAEVVAEPGISGWVVDAAPGLAGGGVGAGEVAHVEAPVEPVLLERLLDHEAQFVDEELVPEPVEPGLNGQEPGPARGSGVAGLGPPEHADAVAEASVDAECVGQDADLIDGRRSVPGLDPGDREVEQLLVRLRLLFQSVARLRCLGSGGAVKGHFGGGPFGDDHRRL